MKIRKKSKAKSDSILNVTENSNENANNTENPTTLNGILETDNSDVSPSINAANTMEPTNSDGNEHKSVPTPVPSLTEILTLKRMILVEDAQGPSCSKANITGNSSISVESMSEILAQLEERLTAVGWSKELFSRLLAIITERKLENIHHKNLAKEVSASAIAAMPENERKAMVEQIREIIGKASAPKIFK